MKPLMTVRPGIFAVSFSLDLGGVAPPNMRPSPHCLCLLYLRPVWSLGLILLAGLSGCGPATSDHAQNPQSHASLGEPSESQSISQYTPAPRNGPFTSAASPVSLAAPPSSNQAPSAAQKEPAPLPDHLVLPAWIAQALDAPEVSVRLQALDMWAQQGAQASLDPLVVALDDEDDDVRTKAMSIIEQQWAIEQESEPEAEN